jgi:hypothetical protein
VAASYLGRIFFLEHLLFIVTCDAILCSTVIYNDLILCVVTIRTDGVHRDEIIVTYYAILYATVIYNDLMFHAVIMRTDGVHLDEIT